MLNFCIWATKKIFFAFCNKVSNSRTQSRRRRVYHQGVSLVYHQRLAVVYHHCESEYSLRLMIYTFGDEIHANAWWYTIAFAMDKKIRQAETCRIFWLGKKDLNPHKQSQSLSCCRYTIPQSIFATLVYHNVFLLSRDKWKNIYFNIYFFR